MAEWFRINLRFGWIKGLSKIIMMKPVTKRGERRLWSTIGKRIRHGLELPYGAKAFALGLAPTAEVPKPPPKKNKKT